MKPNVIYVFLSFLLFSCVKEIDFKVNSVPEKLVVNSILKAYQPVTVNVSALQSIFDSTFLFINNATVVLTEEGGESDTLQYISGGDYRSYIYPKPGFVYHLVVNAPGYPTASATDTVPNKTEIKNATLKESKEVDEYGDPVEEYTITFEKQSSKINYYELFFVSQNKSDSLFAIYYVFNAVSIDPLILSSGTNDYNHKTFLFNDVDLPHGEYTIKMKMNCWLTPGGNFPEPVITLKDNASAVVLRTVSRAYYDYRNSWETHKHFKNDSTKIEDFIYVPLIGEPQEMYTNIENGLGVFVSFSQDYFLLK